MLYVAATAVPHDIFKKGTNPVGPIAKGKSLGLTLKQWSAATGGGTYIVSGNTAELKLSFSKLVPNATYTLWCSRLTFPPNVNVSDKPCGAGDGSQNSFKSDKSGNGSVVISTTPLELSTKTTVSLIALMYQSDGVAHGAIPGDFGLNSHMQMTFIFLPPAK